MSKHGEQGQKIHQKERQNLQKQSKINQKINEIFEKQNNLQNLEILTNSQNVERKSEDN